MGANWHSSVQQFTGALLNDESLVANLKRRKRLSSIDGVDVVDRFVDQLRQKSNSSSQLTRPALLACAEQISRLSQYARESDDERLKAIAPSQEAVSAMTYQAQALGSRRQPILEMRRR